MEEVSDGDKVKDSASRRMVPTTMEAVDVGYEVNGKQILSGVNAIFEPCKMTAILGSSGAGKTTLLNTLSLRSSGHRTGEILVNGAAMSLDKMRQLLSYMPQEDVLYVQLTVRQMLHYSAMLRCRSADWRSRSRSILETLGLAGVADQTVAEVSGGQRKRTSAAVEFLSGRPILFMDEPTSGLDAATAMSLVSTLGSAAHVESRTVVSIVHQPSWALLNKFDHILVLAPTSHGGTVVYDGLPEDLPGYFSSQGSPVAEGSNPADHLMAVLSDDDGGGGGDRWADAWRESSPKKRRTDQIAELRMQSEEENEEELAPYPISFWEQYVVLFSRAVHMWFADPQQGPLIMKMFVGINLIMVLMLNGMPPNLSKANALFYVIVTQLPMTMTPLVIIMPEEKAVILREYRNGVFSANVYWLARFSLAVFHTIFCSAVTTFFTYPLMNFPCTYSKLLRWFSFEFLYIQSIMMLGFALGIASPSAIAGNKIVVAIFIPWLVTAGVLPPLRMMRPAVAWLRFPNLFTWATKLALTTAFTGNGDKAFETVHDDLGYNLGNTDSCYYALLAAFVITFACGLFATRIVLSQTDKSAGQSRPPAAKDKSSGTKGGDRPSEKGAGDAARPKSPLLSSSPKKETQTPKSGGYGALNDDVESPSRSISIEVRRVTYEYGGKRGLDDATVRFNAASVSALMGPSGAGKTTLLNLLAGRLPISPENLISGEVLIDGSAASFEAFKRIGTLTPQDEHLPAVLTVRQTLAYTAELRSPNDWSYAKKMDRVDEILDKLKLTAHADTVIGTQLAIGISGGQKKRLSIAMDLLAELPVMLVDEPTTGLDSAAALNVLETVLSLARTHRRTVVVTMHQPPWSTVLRFDQLVILASGCVVYDGQADGLPVFLQNRGWPTPRNENPADHVMAVLVNAGDAQGNARRLDKKSPYSAEFEEDPPLDPILSPSSEADALLKGDQFAVSQWTQYKILLRRAGYTFFVDEDQFPEVLMPCLTSALFIGLAFRDFGINEYTGGPVLCAITAHGMIIMSGIVLNIPTERQLILREYQNGTYSVAAYWFARTTTSILIAIGASFPIFFVYYPLVGFTSDSDAIFHYWAASTLNCITFSIFAGIIGLACLTPLASAQVSEPIGNCMIIFSGAIISRRFIKPYFLPVFYGLPIGYAFEIALTAVLGNKGEDGQEIIEYYDVKSENRQVDFVILISMAVFWAAAGYLVARKQIAGRYM